jgi:hypothetical protein
MQTETDLAGSEMCKPRRARGKAKRSAEPSWLRTVDAARYLGLSASLLRKYRSMGPDDPGVHGPAFIKVSHNIVLYEIAALDDWLDARRLAALERNAR